MTIWNLIPISPFNEDDIRYKSTFKPLKVPSSLGREELLRPFHCCIKKKSPISTKKKRKKREEPCHVCKSIQDIAKFIPRKDFWCLSYDDEAANDSSVGSSSSRMQLTISGKNVAQLVRICSSSGVVRELDKKLDEQTIHVYDGDILSLLWYNQQSSSSEGGAIKTSSSKLETLVQFRLTKVKEDEEDDTNVADKEESLPDNKVQVSILVDNSQERAAIENNGISNMMSDTKITAAESRDDRDSAKIDQGKDDESMQSDTDDLLYTQEDQMKQEDMHEDDNDSKKSAGVSFQGSSRKLVDDVSAAAAAVPPCIGSVKSSSKDEYESSAPLTLPYEFLASGGESKSYSFDSMDKSPTKLPIDKKNPSTPQKSNISGKRRYDDMSSTDQDTKVVSKTPKKSNVTANNSSPTTLFSSLTHNEMVKLHEQTVPQTTDTKPSLRHTVLSLTLALTSNASAYDSNFLRDCNVETTPNGNGQRSGERQDVKQKWMPRFLQGTKISKLQGNKEED